MMRAYYNEHDPYAAAWLRNLIAAGHITAGDVDDRSIVDVRPADLIGYDRCHFFAGIGVWDYALNLAEWGRRPVWTGSCPCQPFSAAGRQRGISDERHLWPVWFDLIRECGPEAVLGEQVEAAVRLGWLDAVFSDLEGEGYACGAVVLGAHSVGAPHIRQRLWFVADVLGTGLEGSDARTLGVERTAAERGGPAGVLGNANGRRRRQAGCAAADDRAEVSRWETGRRGGSSALNPWSDIEWIPCRDGKARSTQPGLQPLAHGAPARVGRLRAYGNAIVAPVAAEFIRAVLDCQPDRHLFVGQPSVGAANTDLFS